MTGGRDATGGKVPDVVSFRDKLAQIDKTWSPKVVAALNDYRFKLVKIEGEFVWHAHDDTDEAFIVLDGALTIELRNRSVDLAAGEMFVVPRGVEHRPRAESLCSVLLIEPAGIVNTGDAGGELTAPTDDWL